MGEQPKTPNLGRELSYHVRLPALRSEQSAHVADEYAQRADKMAPWLRRRAGARELGERFFYPHFNGHNEEAP